MNEGLRLALHRAVREGSRIARSTAPLSSSIPLPESRSSDHHHQPDTPIRQGTIDKPKRHTLQQASFAALVLRLVIGLIVGGVVGFGVSSIAGDGLMWIIVGAVIGCANAASFNPNSPRFIENKPRK